MKTTAELDIESTQRTKAIMVRMSPETNCKTARIVTPVGLSKRDAAEHRPKSKINTAKSIDAA
jgi:hypothetical protein